jgi:membrane associated rhomboid family serine protease
VALTFLSMASSGGLLVFTFLPLVIGMWRAVRFSGRTETFGWIALSALAGAQWAWEVTYPVTEGDWPSAAIIAAVGGLMTGALLTLGRHYTLTRDVPHRSRASG